MSPQQGPKCPTHRKSMLHPVLIHTYEAKVDSNTVGRNKSPGSNDSKERNCPIEPFMPVFSLTPSFIIVLSPGTSPPLFTLSSIKVRELRCIEPESWAILCTFKRWFLAESLRRNCCLQMRHMCRVDWRCTLFRWRFMSPLRLKVTSQRLASHFSRLELHLSIQW